MGAISPRNGLLALALASTSVSPVAAQDAARMEAIEQQIRALQGELQQLRREAAQREAQTKAAQQDAARAREEAAQARAEAQAAQRRLDTAPPATTAAATPPESEYKVSFPNGRPTFGTADHRIEASLGATFQFDVGSWIDGPSTSGENLRRGRLLFGFKYNDLKFNITPDFGGSPDGSVRLYEANLNWTPDKQLTGTLGYFKPWITLQDSMSSNDFLLLERPSIVEVLEKHRRWRRAGLIRREVQHRPLVRVRLSHRRLVGQFQQRIPHPLADRHRAAGRRSPRRNRRLGPAPRLLRLLRPRGSRYGQRRDLAAPGLSRGAPRLAADDRHRGHRRQPGLDLRA